MINIERVTQAAVNNAKWCNTISLSHSIPGVFHNGYWVNINKMPPYYPNLVTISPMENKASLINEIHNLELIGELKSWAVKDSFMDLDLTNEGLSILFEASWLCLSPDSVNISQKKSTIGYTIIKDDRELYRWELEWEKTNPHEKQFQRIFNLSLLNSPGTEIIAGYIDNTVVSGAIAFITDKAIGISNIFSTRLDLESVFRDIIILIKKHHPEKNIFGYQNGDNLRLLKLIGFQEIGDLRIWNRRAP